MSEIRWLEIILDTTRDRLEGLAARLTMNGVAGLVVEDEEDFRTFLEQNRQYWDYVDQELEEAMKGVCRIKFYVSDDPEGQAQLTNWLEGVEESYTAAPLGENDWATSWQKYYKPLAVGKKLYIVPQWERESAPVEGKTPVYLNPGLTFGTGSHASTQLCLEGMEDTLQVGERVLDLGCGSGILSIAALVLGAESATAVDIDPKAVDVAYENAGLNGIGRERYTVLAGDVIGDKALLARLGRKSYQLVLANIVADVIIPLAPSAQELMAPGGAFLCSGVIDTRADEVQAALTAAGMTVVRKMEQDGWVAFLARI